VCARARARVLRSVCLGLCVGAWVDVGCACTHPAMHLCVGMCALAVSLPRSPQPRAPVTVIFERSSSRPHKTQSAAGSSAPAEPDRPRANSLPTHAERCSHASRHAGRFDRTEIVAQPQMKWADSETHSAGEQRRRQSKGLAATAALGRLVRPAADASAVAASAPGAAEPRLTCDTRAERVVGWPACFVGAFRRRGNGFSARVWNDDRMSKSASGSRQDCPADLV
jgi:hypothetical protein